jgi:hypothetical protein
MTVSKEFPEDDLRLTSVKRRKLERMYSKLRMKRMKNIILARELPTFIHYCRFVRRDIPRLMVEKFR